MASSMSLRSRSSSCDARVLAMSLLLLAVEEGVEAVARSVALMAAAKSWGEGAPNVRKPPARELFREHTPMLEVEDFLELPPPA